MQTLQNQKAGQPSAIPTGEALNPLNTWSRSFSKGLVFSRQETITVKQPGYYHVLLRVQAKNEKKVTREGMPVVNSTWNDAWIWISPQGGKTTTKFNAKLFPKNMRTQPGPLTRMTEPSQLQYEPSVQASSTGTVTILVNYRDKSKSYVSYESLKNTHVKYFLSSSGVVDHTGTEQTNDQGVVTIPCLAGENSYTVKIFNQNTDVKVYDGPYGSNATTFAVETTGSLGSDCGHTIVVNSQNSYIFADMNQVITNSRSFFQKSRGQISVYRKFSGSVSAYYEGADYISIADNNDSDPGSDYGQYSIAHEYGHALQEKGLGGIPPHNCLDPHYYNNSSNSGCAYTEGFANYHAATTSTNSSPYFPAETITLSGSDPDGSIVEAGVVSFLYDLTDPANESYDNANYPGSYVADIVQHCQVDGNAANGIDHLIACFQHGIPDYSNHFPTRNNPPSLYSESATEPSGWNKTDIKKLWYEDLYEQSYTPPPAPSLSVNINGPAVAQNGDELTFYANVSDADGPVSYQWFYRQESTDPWMEAGQNLNNFQHYVWSNASPGEYIYNGIKVEVSSAGEMVSAILSVKVYGCPPTNAPKQPSPNFFAPVPCN